MTKNVEAKSVWFLEEEIMLWLSRDSRYVIPNKEVTLLPSISTA